MTGMRGAGKTFWWTALQKPSVRRLLAQQDERLAWSESAHVGIGFGTRPSDQYPGRAVLRSLSRAGAEPRTIWRTVQAWQVAPEDHPLRACGSWRARISYVDTKPEAVDRLFQDRDAECDRRGLYYLTLFDALDRSSDDWNDMYPAIRGLVQTALEMRSYRRLRVKVFLRSDQINDKEVADAPDASKALSSMVELSWPRHELYGLLWHRLTNGPDGQVFRQFLQPGDWPSGSLDGRTVVSVPRRLVRDEAIQRGKFHEIAGRWMGTDRRRGFPYAWIPNHLGDSERRVSPRSFLAALRMAAEDTAERYPDCKTALHCESIRRGVRSASRVRVQEVEGDYPWVRRVMGALEGMVVPCRFEEIAERWRAIRVVDQLAEVADEDGVRLLPRRIDLGADGVREALEFLGVFFRMRDGRVNIPDVYRVGYGLGREGGVKPSG
ncbi:MAG: hypothetical protein OXH69_17040 [Acidobacteria bacterium]|nr:hypothetical protein [Acidobacteriota bacterium]